MSDPRRNARDIYPPTGPEITAKSWLTEAPMRMLMNNLHPDVAVGRVPASDKIEAIRYARDGVVIVVTNEVGLSVVPPSELGRAYRDTLGRVIQRWVAASDRALFVVAGRALPLHGPESFE